MACVTSGNATLVAVPDAERTPKYGLTDRSGKPARIAANDFSRAINGLKGHHDIEPEGVATADARFRSALSDISSGEAASLAARADQILESAAKLRDQRAQLLEALLALREPLVDLLLEEHDARHPDAMLTANVEPPAPFDAPEAAGGVTLEAPNALRVVAASLNWTQRESYAHALEAVGPAYLLGWVIEHPAPEARALREAAQAAHKRLLGFLIHPWRYRPTWELL